MFNHRRITSVIMGRSGWRFSTVPVAAALMVALGASNAGAQECQTDADCGFGFRCHQEVISTTSSSVSGVSGTTTFGTTGGPFEPECGNSVCDETEDPESCPDDCGFASYCVGASCDADSDCAEDYSCQREGSIYSTTTTGSDVPVCGDYQCDESESEESCLNDCNTETTCQMARCKTDADCSEGYYCDPKGGSAVSSATTSGGGTEGSSYSIELYLSECLPLPSDGSGGNGTSGGPGPVWPPHKPPYPGCAVVGALPGGSAAFALLTGLFACGLVQRRRRNQA